MQSLLRQPVNLKHPGQSLDRLAPLVEGVPRRHAVVPAGGDGLTDTGDDRHPQQRGDTATGGDRVTAARFCPRVHRVHAIETGLVNGPWRGGPGWATGP